MACDATLLRNNVQVYFDDENLDNVRSVEVNSLPVVSEYQTIKFYVEEAISKGVEKPWTLWLDRYDGLKLYAQGSFFFNSTLISTKTIFETSPKTFVDSLSENDRNRGGITTVLNDQDNEFDLFQLKYMDSITIERNPSSHNELPNKNYSDDKFEKEYNSQF